MEQNELHKLLDKYLAGQTTRDEEKWVENWLDRMAVDDNEWSQLNGEEKEQHVQQLFARIKKSAISTAAPVRRMNVIKYWAVAATIVVAILTTVVVLQNKKDNEMQSAQTDAQQQFNNLLPAEQSVLLTLADGTIIRLDSVAAGTIAYQGQSQITKNASGIVYDDAKATEVVYNTVATQKGKIYHLQLPDGTKVWLDAVSSIRFPTAFTGQERVVEITGQVYFEVAQALVKGTRTKQSFKVQSGQQIIEVLGTHFNVNATEIGRIETTLLEGLVQVSANDATIRLQPGQQSVAAKGGLQLQKEIDIEKIMAWKTGWFDFDNADLPTIMQQISRWYDVEVHYEGAVTKEKFGGRINKNVPLSKVLQFFEGSGVRFKLEEKVLIVQQ